MTGIAESWLMRDGSLVRRSRTARSLASRAGLVALYGTYEPDETTTGCPVPLDSLTEYNSPTTDKVDLPAGDYERQIIYGDIKPPASGEVNISECYTPGGTSSPTSDTGIFNCTGNARTHKINVYDTTVIARVPKNGRNGFQGRQYHAERCLVKDVTDAFGSFSTLGSNTVADVMILACMADELLYTYPDPATSNHSDGAHTDVWQHQGGHQAYCMYSSLRGYASAASTGTNPDKPWLMTHNPPWANGACVTLQDNTGAGISSDVQAVGNWTRGGQSHYNLKLSAANAVVSDGHVYRDVAIGSGLSGYWARQETGTTQSSFSGIDTLEWVDGPYAGQLLTFASRDRGLHIG